MAAPPKPRMVLKIVKQNSAAFLLDATPISCHISSIKIAFLFLRTREKDFISRLTNMGLFKEPDLLTTKLKKISIIMVKHIVLFKFNDFSSEVEKKEKLNEIKDALLNLLDKVEALNSIEIGINENPNEQFDLSLTSTHDSMDKLKEYATHPDHVQVSKDLIRPILASRSCVDYSL